MIGALIYVLMVCGVALIASYLLVVKPRYALLCLACIAGYMAPSLLNLPTTGVWWFVELSSWSFAIILAAKWANCGRATTAVMVIESFAILLNLVCLWQYMTVTGWIYSIYGSVIDALVIAEAAALIIGAPWNGIRRMVRERWGDHHNLDPAYMRGGLDRPEGQA